MSMQTVQHEPSMVPQSTGQKYQNVLPGQIQGTEQQQKYKLHEGLMNPSQPQLPPQFQPHGQYQSSRRIQFQGGDIQINISTESVQLLNQLINLLIKTNYVCHSIAYYFDRADIGLYGVADFFRNCSLVKYRETKFCMDYLMVRGSEVVLNDIEKPEKNEWGTPVQALEYWLNIHRNIYEVTLKVYQTGQKVNDAHLTDFLEEFMLRPISLWTRRIGVLISNAEKAGPTLGTYQLNKHLCYNMKMFFETNKEITNFFEL